MRRFFMFLLLLAPAALHAQSGCGEVSGVVRQDDAPVRGAAVSVAGATTSKAVITDGTGHFRLTMLPCGTPLALVAALPGFTSDPVSVCPDADDPVDVTIQMKQIQSIAQGPSTRRTAARSFTVTGSLHNRQQPLTQYDLTIDLENNPSDAVSSDGSKPTSWPLRTDAKGRFSASLPSGSYTLHLELPDSTTYSRSFILGPSATLPNLDVVMTSFNCPGTH